MPSNDRRRMELLVEAGRRGIEIPQDAISAITGQPIPTGAEEIGQSKDFTKTLIREGAPIVGDIATSFIPGLAPVKGAKFGLQLLKRMLASSAGSGGGELAGQLATREPLDLQDIRTQMELGAAGEFGIAGAGTLSKPVQFLADKLSSGTLSGGGIKQYFRRRMIEKTTDRVKDFTKQFSPDDVPPSAMFQTDLSRETGEFFENMTDFNTAYAPFNASVERAAFVNNGEILLDDTAQLLGEQLERFGGNQTQLASFYGFTGEKNAGAAQALSDLMREGFSNPEDVHLLLRKIWVKFGGDSASARAAKSTLKDTIVSDIERWAPHIQLGMADSIPGAKAAKVQADKLYGEIHDFLKDSPGVKEILAGSTVSKGTVPLFKDKPDVAIRKLYERSSPDQLIAIRGHLQKTAEGAKIWEGLKFQWVRNLIDQSMAPLEGAGKASGLKMILPAQLSDNILANELKLKSALGEDTWNALKKEAEDLAAVAPEFAKFERGGTARNLLLTGVVAGGLGSAGAIPVIEGFGAITALALASPTAKRIISQMGRAGAKGAIRLLPRNQQLQRTGQ